MKYIILLFFISLPVLACQNSIPMSEVVKAIALEPNAGSKSCKDLPLEECVCYEGIDWRDADLVDNMVLDFVRKDGEVTCLDEDDCQVKLEALACSSGKPVKNLESLSVYCAVEVLKKSGVKLVENPAKEAARKLAEKNKEDAEKAKELKKKSFEFKGTSIAQLRAELNEFIQLMKE